MFYSFTLNLNPLFIVLCISVHAMQFYDSVSKSWDHFLTETNSWACILFSIWRDSVCDIGSLGFVPGGGLRACPTSFIMPLPIKQRKLYCSGVIPRGLSSLACHLAANCWSKRDKSCSPPLHALIALREREREWEREREREREEGWGPPFWHGGTEILVAQWLCGWFWHRMSRTEVNGVSISSVSFQLIQIPMVEKSVLMHELIMRSNS